MLKSRRRKFRRRKSYQKNSHHHHQNFKLMEKKSSYPSLIGSKNPTSFICDCCKRGICSSSGYVTRRLACGNTITCKTCYQMLGSSLTYVLNNPEIYIFRCIYCRKERGSNNYTNMCSCCSEKILGTSLMDCINNSEKY